MWNGELPDLEETASGKELIAIGEKRGFERGFERALERGLTSAILVLMKDRFGSVPVEMERRIQNLSRADEEKLLILVSGAKTLKAVETWLVKQMLRS